MPVRSIPRSYRSLTGKVNHARNHVAVAFESALERDFYLLLDFDATVASFEEQPVHIGYEHPMGSHRTYTPDVLVYYRAASALAQTPPPPTLYEVKYREELRAHWAEYKAKFKAAQRYARQQNWRFRLISEREIRTPYLKNVKFLREYRCRVVDRHDRDRLLAVLAEQGETDAQALLTRLSPTRAVYARLLPVLWHLVAVGQIGAQLAVPLTMRTALWLRRPPQGERDG